MYTIRPVLTAGFDKNLKNFPVNLDLRVGESGVANVGGGIFLEKHTYTQLIPREQRLLKVNVRP